ncbi:hypothetical protein CHS0354_009669 [Potamilus streckersoni]|uniref:Lipase domain-containing protein n=1 Tax=Potamilus streckersoni TaxID=2493646 RepID=A0AAE0S3Z2_9BIVA|nr:hypothetical protein CHS0354_009669 [Potamilus streckersoni]
MYVYGKGLIKDSYSVCYDLIGCFKSGKPYHNALFFLPQSPSEIGIKYNLFTRRNAQSAQLLTTNVNIVRSSNFDGSKDTKIIIHGYKHSTSHQWEENMKDEILKRAS